MGAPESGSAHSARARSLSEAVAAAAAQQWHPRLSGNSVSVAATAGAKST